jgi:hypothetical protein
MLADTGNSNITYMLTKEKVLEVLAQMPEKFSINQLIVKLIMNDKVKSINSGKYNSDVAGNPFRDDRLSRRAS